MSRARVIYFAVFAIIIVSALLPAADTDEN